MPVQVLLPKVGFTMEEAEISEWLIPDGAEVVEGQPLFSFESDKSTQEVESPASGRLRILQETGVIVKVGSILAEIE